MDTLFAPDLAHLSRREFLKLSGAGLLSLFWLPFLDKVERYTRLNEPAAAQGPAIRLGRCVDDNVEVYDRPTFSGKLRRAYWRDVVLKIEEVTIGDNVPAYNRVWYRVNGEGYAHSGKIQPVDLVINKVERSVPSYGRLARVTVPYTDTIRNLKRTDEMAYRLYYDTVHWVTNVTVDADKHTRYELYDDKFKENYYVRAEHMRMILPVDIAPISPDVPLEAKHIEIWLQHQLVIAYENNEPALITRAATGGHFIDGDYSTPQGSYITNRKRPSRHMASEDLAAPNSYDLPGVPWVSYLTKSGISLHGTYWHNDFGKPRSHGCVNLSPAAALWFYRWTMPAVPYDQSTWIDDVGTTVIVL
jgi:hypothetical protein